MGLCPSNFRDDRFTLTSKEEKATLRAMRYVDVIHRPLESDVSVGSYVGTCAMYNLNRAWPKRGKPKPFLKLYAGSFLIALKIIADKTSVKELAQVFRLHPKDLVRYERVIGNLLDWKCYVTNSELNRFLKLQQT